VDSPAAVVVHVHGEDDDALRIVAELAAALVSPAATTSKCLVPSSSWEERQREAAQLLSRERTAAGRTLVVVDPDDLPNETSSLDDEARWDDRAFVKARHAVRQMLVQHAAQGGNVVFVRSRPTLEVTAELEALGIGSDEDDEDPLADLMPFVRPLARWLLMTGVLDDAALKHWIRTTDEPDLSDLVVHAAWESITSVARAALDRLAVLRGPQALNGVAGPFAIDDSDAPLSVSRRAVDELIASGWLQTPPTGSGRELPNALRRFLMPRLRLTGDPEPLHAAIVQKALPHQATMTVPQATEVHHHAVDSGSTDLALRTATFFVNDLRRLAYRLSTAEERYADAAKIYRTIVENDPKDAYAHQYLAYNLHKANGGAKLAASDEVLRHYECAKSLEPTNPLFVGRWLACRAGRGENVTTELKRQIRRFRINHGKNAVSFLARTPLSQMPRDQRNEVAREWRWLLQQDEHLRALLP
jgi:hypothetical protein